MGFNISYLVNKFLNVQSHVKEVILQDAATVTGNGTPLDVGSTKTLTIEITGTSTSRTIIFEASSISGTYYQIKGQQLSPSSSYWTQTTGNNEVWQFDVTGLAFFRAKLYAVAGGSVTIKGRAVT